MTAQAITIFYCSRQFNLPKYEANKVIITGIFNEESSLKVYIIHDVIAYKKKKKNRLVLRELVYKVGTNSKFK